MTPDEYWQAMARYYTGTLTENEERHYQMAGIFAESSARDRGTSLLPYPMQKPDVPPDELQRDTLIVLGLTVLALTHLPERS